MKSFKEKGFSERLSASAAARQDALQRLKAKLDPNDPAAVERRAERAAIAAAREARVAEREAARRAEEERLAAEKAAREAAEKAEREARQIREAEEQEALQAAQKAARDARYAARKARGKK
jgi:hypothetical protein